MGTITININSDDKLGLAMQDESKGQNAQVSAEHSSDGGAPGLDFGSDMSTSASAQLDIGGPPQWLTEALSREGQALASVSASGDLQGIDDSDAGAARVSGGF